MSRLTSSPLTGATETVRWEGGRLRVLDTGGSGSEICLLLHGLGNSVEYWYPTAEILRSVARVIALDIPGFGESTRPRAGVSLGSAIGAVMHVVGALGLPVVAIGHSMGAAVTIALAVDQPELVKRAVLIGGAVDEATDLLRPATWHHLNSSAGWLAAQAIAGLVPVPASVAVPAMRSSAGRALLLAPFVANPRQFDWRMAAQLASMSRHPRSLVEALLIARRTRIAALLKDCDVPTILVTGSHDRLATVKAQHRLARLPAVIADITIEGCGHWPQLERPDCVASIIVSTALGR